MVLSIAFYCFPTAKWLQVLLSNTNNSISMITPVKKVNNSI